MKHVAYYARPLCHTAKKQNLSPTAESHTTATRTPATTEREIEQMSLVDYASSSDEDVPEPTEQGCKKEEEPQPPPRSQTKSGSSSNQQLENKSHSSLPSVEKLPDASLLLDAPTVLSNLMSASDHFSRVSAAQAENASRKRDSNGMSSSSVRSKVPRGNLPHSRNVPETSAGMLLPPQISGRCKLMGGLDQLEFSKNWVRKPSPQVKEAMARKKKGLIRNRSTQTCAVVGAPSFDDGSPLGTVIAHLGNAKAELAELLVCETLLQKT
ncbi:unnamed protein product [Sphenostylis stenocarpa]|uniref:Uncharacterized protein n=1 Tax=Sphenostylis stenocarpa TaxID=92480 RepID=A0AA86SGY2_9FABA|nr:unnamed protein product [Sphenostylis stenocarpa]